MTTFEKTPGWLDWCPHPQKPEFRLPHGAVDAHCHVFGPAARFPYAAERRYTPADAPKEALAALHALAQRGQLKRDLIDKAIRDFGLDPEKPDPVAS